MLKRSAAGENFEKLTKDFNSIFDLIKELDSEQSNIELKISGKHGTLEKLEKTTAVIDNAISDSFLTRFGFSGITFQNME